MAKTDKLEKIDFKNLIELRDEVSATVYRLRAAFDSVPTEKFNKFNSLLGKINQEIEDRIENEYLE